MQSEFIICGFYVPSQEDISLIQENIIKYPVKIFTEYEQIKDISYPIQIIGWEKTKKTFPNQNILDKKINNNLFWSFSSTEDKQKFFEDTEEFLFESIKKWFPDNFITYSSIFSKFDIPQILNSDIVSFLYFNKNALYIFNDGKNFIFDISNISKNDMTYILNKINCVSFSYKNFSKYVNINKINNIITLENIRWVKYGVETTEKYFNFVPNFYYKKYIPFIMDMLYSKTQIDEEENGAIIRVCKSDNITEWLSTRNINFDHVNEELRHKIKYRGCHKFLSLNHSNKKTITGRISTDDIYNIQGLGNEHQDRKNITSRFENGYILKCDYVSFEPRISMYFSEDLDFINKNENLDIHIELAKIIFDKQEITEGKRNFAKIINISIIYGSGKKSIIDKLSKIPNSDPEFIYNKIMLFLNPIIKKSNEIKEKYLKDGYIINNWGTIIKPKKEKDYAAFNNLIQSSAAEIMIDKLWDLRDFLKDKKSQLLFQIYDAIVFDIHPDEKKMVYDLKIILSQFNDMKFILDFMVGKNYKEMKKIIV